MKRNLNKQPSTILSMLLFSIGLLISFNIFAEAEGRHHGGAIASQATDTALQNQIDALQTQIDNIPTPTVYEIGDHHAGGIVFYVTEDGQHGLIAALSDQDDGRGIQWYNGTFKDTGATGDGIGAGAMNTAIIVGTQSNDTPGGNFAAKVAADYAVLEDGLTPCTDSTVEACYGDWYLPSKYELNLMYTNIPVEQKGGFTETGYWSSTEKGRSQAWFQLIENGFQGNHYTSATMRVRPIRAF